MKNRENGELRKSGKRTVFIAERFQKSDIICSTREIIGYFEQAGKSRERKSTYLHNLANKLGSQTNVLTFIAHGRRIRAAGSATSTNDGNHRNSGRADIRDIVEIPATVVLVRKDFGLERKKSSAGIDQVY
jgi:hypothetical protein